MINYLCVHFPLEFSGEWKNCANLSLQSLISESESQQPVEVFKTHLNSMLPCCFTGCTNASIRMKLFSKSKVKCFNIYTFALYFFLLNILMLYIFIMFIYTIMLLHCVFNYPKYVCIRTEMTHSLK